MTKQTVKTEAQPDKKNRPKAEPPVPEGLTSEFAGLAQLPADSISLGTIQAARLSDPRLPLTQRQALAGQIGRVQGNQHLQRVVETLKPNGRSSKLQAPLETRVIARLYDDGPYTPGEMSQRYWELSAAERVEVNAEVDRRFQAETGVTRRLDPKKPEDQPLMNIWLRIRDEVMTERVGEPEEPDPTEPQPEEPKPEEPKPAEPKPEEPKPAEPKPEPPKTGLSYEEAKKQIEAAGKGWGTDEEGMYAAIRQCYERDKLAADPAVKAILEDELSGHDLWKAQLLLAFGSEAAFPKPIQEIWSATEGWGTDEERIYRALQALNETEMAKINKTPGLKEMLESELSGKELKAAEDLLSGEYAKAIARHQANVAEMTARLNEMRSGTLIEQNTAEWLVPTKLGGVAKNDLHVATLTHDAKARAKEHGYKDNFSAFFGAKEIYPDASSTYDAEITSDRNIRFVQDGTGGHHLERDIWIYEPTQLGKNGKVAVKTILIHEVQHDADRHDEEEGYGGSGAKESWNRYKTEFRAYWQDGRFDALTDASDPAQAPWDNQRQRAIYNMMTGSGIYPWLKKAYDANEKVDGTEFQTLVHGYVRPEGVNLENSPRIDDFFLKLGNCKKKDTDLTIDPLKALESTANQLDAHDQAYVNSDQAKRLQQMMKDNLAATPLQHIATIANGGTLPDWAKGGTP